ncbi:MAG: 2'-5' RNA ligase family protein [Sphingobacteriales bacterium]|nr:MAG: 2'-5' RNA ligase family protein [Sphingobacteriales bacterium]
MSKTGLYMLAVMPAPDVTKEIEGMRIQFAEKYHCKAALKPPVHITLIPPFKSADTIEPIIIKEIELLASTQSAFSVSLHNYDVFRENQVVFIHVEPEPPLWSLQRLLQEKFLTDYSHFNIKTFKNFAPHITIGYRDIPREVFRAAAIEYLAKPYSATFPVNEFYLWKHNSVNWQVLYTFHLKQP